MSIDFPSSPSLNQVFTTANSSYVWNGTQWVGYSTSVSQTLQTLDQTLGYGNTSSFGMSAGISTFNNVIVGGATTGLIVNGDARITGILTIGTSSITLDGDNNQIKIGTGVTIYPDGDGFYSGIVTGSAFVKSGGTSSEFLKADGSVDTSIYATETYVGLATTGLLSSTGSGINLTGIVTFIDAGSGISVDQNTGRVTITATGSGLTVKDEDVTVGTANSVTSINFVGENVTAIASGTISTITVTTQTYVQTSGISSYSISSGIATYATTTGVSTSVIGGISSVTQLQVTGISTFTNGPVLIGSGTSTGTTSQPLQITGGGYISSNLGIGTTNPKSTLSVNGDVSITGVLTASGGIGTSYYIYESGDISGTYNVVFLGQTGAGNTYKPLQINNGSLTFNPGTNTLTVSNLAGTAGNASQINISALSSSDVTTSVVLVGAQTLGAQSPFIDSGLLYNASTNVLTAAGFSGTATNATTAGYATTAGISTNVIGGISSVTQLQVTGISTFTNGPILVGSGTSTGTASQPLQVTGGAYVSSNLGVGSTSPTSKLDVVGDVKITGVTTITGNLNALGNSYVKLARTTDQTISNGTDTLIGFSIISDPNNWYSGITTRTTPTVAGTYHIDVMINWYEGTVTNNQTNIQLRKNGTTFALSQVGIHTFAYTMNACGIVTMNGTTDYIDFTVYTSNPTSQVVRGTSDGAWTKMEVFKIN